MARDEYLCIYVEKKKGIWIGLWSSDESGHFESAVISKKPISSYYPLLCPLYFSQPFFQLWKSMTNESLPLRTNIFSFGIEHEPKNGAGLLEGV